LNYKHAYYQIKSELEHIALQMAEIEPILKSKIRKLDIKHITPTSSSFSKCQW